MAFELPNPTFHDWSTKIVKLQKQKGNRDMLPRIGFLITFILAYFSIGHFLTAGNGLIREALAQRAASNSIIFIDASASVKDFATAYRQSMQGLASRAREMHQNDRSTIFFVPIGDGTGGVRSLPNTGMSFEDLNEALTGPFSFGAQTTKISQSLDIGRAIPNVSRIMIVSDLVPDHRASGGPFMFSRQDMEDLISARTMLRSYLDNPNLEKLGLILLGWDRDPASYLSETERADPEKVIQAAKRENERRLGRNSSAESEHANEALYRKATAAMIVSLKNHSDKISVTAMARIIGNRRNEQGFFLEACRVFDNVLSGDQRCASGEEVARCVAGDGNQPPTVQETFSVAVDRGRYQRDQVLLNVLKERFRAPLSGPRVVTPRQLRIFDKGELGSVVPDFEISLCVLKVGGAPECSDESSFAPPDLRRLGWRLNGRTSNSDRTTIQIGPVHRVSAGGNDGRAREGLANDVEKILREYIGQSFRPPQQKIWITLKTQAGVAIPRGHRIVARYKFADQDGRVEGLILDETGSLALPLPAAAEQVNLYHHSDQPSGPVEIKIGDTLPQDIVGTCEIYNQIVQDVLFVPYRIAVDWPSEPRIGVEGKVGRLSIRLTDGDHEQPLVRQEIRGSDQQVVRLPPGAYNVTLKVQDPRLLQPQTVPFTWSSNAPEAAEQAANNTRNGAASSRINISDFEPPSIDERQSADEQGPRFQVEIDRLLRTVSEQDIAREQVDVAANYLAPPAEAWRQLQELMRNNRLTPRGERLAVLSANTFWAVISVVSELIDRQAATGQQSNDLNTADVRVFLRELADKVISPAGRDPETSRDIGRGLRRIGLIKLDMSDHPDGMTLLNLLMVRLDKHNLCSQQTDALQLAAVDPAFTPKIIAEFNSWLLQSSVRPDQREGSAAPLDLTARVPSNTPFTVEFVRKCHVRLDERNRI